MTIKIQRFTQNLLMMGWGVTCLYWGIFADFENLLHPQFQLPVIGAGVIFILLTVLSADSPSVGRCSHDLSWESLGMGVVGILVVILCRPEGLSMKTALNREGGDVVVDAFGRDQALAQNWGANQSKELIFLDLLDLFYVARDPKLREEIVGKKIGIIGQVVEKKGFSLMRMTMWCCVADARPVMVEMRGVEEGRWKEGDWIEVRGGIEFEEQGGTLLPVIRYQGAKPVLPPEDIYIY